MRHFLISRHAAKRFRERYLTASERDEMNIGTIGDWLDQLVRYARDRDAFEEILDPGPTGALLKAVVFQILPRRDGDPPLYAYARDADAKALEEATATAPTVEQASAAPRQIIVTLLDAWMRDKNRRERWRDPDGRPLDAPTGRLRPLRASIEDRRRQGK